MKAPPDRIKIVSFNAKVIKSLLNKVMVLDIILKVKQVRQFPIRPNSPTKQITVPEIKEVCKYYGGCRL